jgi:hypothetical protein
MPAQDVLASISSIVAGFGTAVLLFRIQRELYMDEKKQPQWVPGSDWMLIVAIGLSLLFVLLPITAINFSSTIGSRIPVASCAASLILMAGYPFAILAHYRLILYSNIENGTPSIGPEEDQNNGRVRTEPAEAKVILVTGIVSVFVGVIILVFGQITL